MLFCIIIVTKYLTERCKDIRIITYYILIIIGIKRIWNQQIEKIF